MSNILQPKQSLTFSQYFSLPYLTSEIIAEFDYSYHREELELPQYSEPITYLEFLERYIKRNIALVNPRAEISIREFLVAPILIEVCDAAKSEIYSEYTLNATEQLKGNLDYYMVKANSLIVIEAKLADIKRGFTQLAIELIALDKHSKLNSNILYGAVTNGDTWKFGVLYRDIKLVKEDIKIYKVPEELESLVRILMGILN